MKIKITALIILISVFLCSCTAQTDFDVFDFCERYNSLREEKILSTDSFLSDGEGGLYCFMTVGESRLLITLKTDEKNCVNSIFVTAQRKKYSENDRDEIINTAEILFASFNYGDSEKATKMLSSVGFDEEYEPFSAVFSTTDEKNYRYTLYSDEYSFTVCAEKIEAD